MILVKLFIFTILSMALVGLSLVGMIYGWGLEAKNWGWVAFSYLGVIIASCGNALKD